MPTKWYSRSALALAILFAAALSSCGRRVQWSRSSFPDAGFGGEAWVAVEKAAGSPQREGQQAKLHMANGFLWWSVDLGHTRMVNLASGEQSNVSPLSFQVMEGSEGFTTVSAAPLRGHLTDIIAVDLASGRRRTVVQIGCNLDTLLALDATYLYFIQDYDGACGQGPFRVRRDGTSRPEFVPSQPSLRSKDFAVEGGYLYWSHITSDEKPFADRQGEITRRKLEIDSTSTPERVAHSSSEHFHIAEGRLYFVNNDAIWSVRLDGSDLTRQVEVGPAGASHILVDRGTLYWANEREIRRLNLSGDPSRSSEIIEDEETYRGQTNIATDGQNLCWYDLRHDRILCLGRDARSLPPRPRRVAKAAPDQGPTTVMKKADWVSLGQSWACASVSGQAGGHWWQCWEPPSVAGTHPVANPAPWMLALWPPSAPERLCTVFLDKIRCWPGPGLRLEPLGALLRKQAFFNERRDPLFVGSTFTCGSDLETVDPKRPAWACEGDNSFHQFAGFQTASAFDNPALGPWHACAATESRSLSCWGRGDGGQLGYRPSETCRVGGRTIGCSSKGHDVPIDVSLGDYLLAGDMFTCVASSDTGVTCFGASRDGWFGNASECPEGLRTQWPTTEGFVRAPNATCSAKPTAVLGLQGIRSTRWGQAELPLSLGPRGACAIINGHIRCVGAIPTPSTEVNSVVVNPGNRANACGIADGNVVCWGEEYSPNNDPSTAVAVELYSPQRSEAAVVDFPAPQGKSWPASYAIYRRCALAVQTISKCPAGTTGEPWSNLAPRAWALLGQRITVRDRMVVGTWTTRSRPGIGQGSIVLGDGDPPLSLRDGYDCEGDESRLCCDLPAFGQTVVATGTLWRNNEWLLRDLTICEIDGAAEANGDAKKPGGSEERSP
jgi:hypothetical protein